MFEIEEFINAAEGLEQSRIGVGGGEQDDADNVAPST